MSFCPNCGAPTSSAMAFCTSCGTSLARAVYPQAQGPGQAPGAPAQTQGQAQAVRGALGTHREPWLVVVLSLVTLGVYALYYWWVSSREVDAYAGKPGHSHGLVKIGVVVSLVAGVAFVILFASFFFGMFALMLTGGEPDASMAGAFVGGILTLILVGTALFVGSVVLLVGKYRVWEAIEQDEKRRMHPTPLSATLMLVLTLASFVVPFAGFVLPLVVLYLTQEHLNQAWAAGALPVTSL